jgi:hypothetical protein
MHPGPRSTPPEEWPGRRRTGDEAGTAGVGGCAFALVFMIAACAQDGPEGTNAPRGHARQAIANPVPVATDDHDGIVAEPPHGLEADQMPPMLADLPLPDDVIFVAPPLRDFGRLIVSLNSQMDADQIAAWFDTQLPVHGYEIRRKIVAGTTQWQFVKDGRRGLVAVEENRLATVITINLFIEDVS